MKGINYLSTIPMRREPSDKAEMVNQLLYGEIFDVVEKLEKWSRIKLHHDQYEGWIDNKQYSEISSNKRQQIYTVNKLFVKHEKMILPMGSFIQNSKFIIHNSDTSLLQTAKLFLGVPYLWGGRTFMGIDCSGFTQVVFRNHGIRLLRDTYQQETQGKKIKFDQLMTGDLAFFRNAEGRVIHVGIIICEKNTKNIIHASGKVRIDVFDEEGIYNEETKSYSHRLHSIKRVG
ncbi:MAG: ykfC [Bacteroidota bacterium]|nr:ykfC [Bacteroidota bacterium]